MTEHAAFIAIRSAILDAFAVYGYTAAVMVGRQPTKQLLQDNTVYLFAINEARTGVQGRQYTKTGDISDLGHVERSLVTKTVQVQAFRQHDITDPDDYTASDLCAAVRMIVDSLPFQESIRKAGVATCNTTLIREPEFVNDAGDYEKNPSFDFDMTFVREIHPITVPITTATAEAHGI